MKLTLSKLLVLKCQWHSCSYCPLILSLTYFSSKFICLWELSNKNDLEMIFECLKLIKELLVCMQIFRKWLFLLESNMNTFKCITLFQWDNSGCNSQGHTYLHITDARSVSLLFCFVYPFTIFQHLRRQTSLVTIQMRTPRVTYLLGIGAIVWTRCGWFSFTFVATVS